MMIVGPLLVGALGLVHGSVDGLVMIDDGLSLLMSLVIMVRVRLWDRLLRLGLWALGMRDSRLRLDPPLHRTLL